jgi:MFS family permease
MSLAFMTYFCMFAFRKPFTVGTYEGVSLLGTQIDLKTALVLSQIIGYTLSKFIGIKVNSELGRSHRAFAIVATLTAAEVALILFALTPANWKIVPIFFNGLCLGMIWGLVVAYLEGRGTSEILLAGLSCSYIVATGVVKDCGRWVLSWGVGESWMPALTGVPFLLLLFLIVYGLDKIPEPNHDDVRMRCQRAPMLSADRWRFFTRFSAGMISLILFYFFLTAYRDFRDLYGQEIFANLGYGETPGIFSMTELPVAFGVMLALALLNTVQNPRAGTVSVFGLLLVGMAIIGSATVLFDTGRIHGVTWMILTGLGGYLAYVPFGSVLFDRIIASTRFVGTAVFAIYVLDALGYTGSVMIQLYKDIFAAESTRLDFFRNYSYFMALLGVVCSLVGCFYFDRKVRNQVQTGSQ